MQIKVSVFFYLLNPLEATSAVLDPVLSSLVQEKLGHARESPEQDYNRETKRVGTVQPEKAWRALSTYTCSNGRHKANRTRLFLVMNSGRTGDNGHKLIMNKIK